MKLKLIFGVTLILVLEVQAQCDLGLFNQSHIDPSKLPEDLLDQLIWLQGIALAGIYNLTGE